MLSLVVPLLALSPATLAFAEPGLRRLSSESSISTSPSLVAALESLGEHDEARKVNVEILGTSSTVTTSTSTVTTVTDTTLTTTVPGGRTCFVSDIAYMQPDAQLNMNGITLTEEGNAEMCQRRCAETNKCVTFTFLELNKDCYLQNQTSMSVPWPGSISGQRYPPGIDCDVYDAVLKQFPQKEGTSPSDMYAPQEPPIPGSLPAVPPPIVTPGTPPVPVAPAAFTSQRRRQMPGAAIPESPPAAPPSIVTPATPVTPVTPGMLVVPGMPPLAPAMPVMPATAPVMTPATPVTAVTPVMPVTTGVSQPVTQVMSQPLPAAPATGASSVAEESPMSTLYSDGSGGRRGHASDWFGLCRQAFVLLMAGSGIIFALQGVARRIWRRGHTTSSLLGASSSEPGMSSSRNSRSGAWASRSSGMWASLRDNEVATPIE